MTSLDLSLRHLRIVYNHNKSGTVNNYTKLPRPFSSVAYFIGGSLEFHIGDRVETAREGDLIFVPYSSTYYSVCEDHADYLSLYFLMKPFDGHMGQYRIEKLNGQWLYDDFKYLYDNTVMNNPAINTDRLTFGAMSRVYSILAAVQPQLHVTEIKPPDPRIAKALNRLDEHFDEPLKVAELAGLCHLSESHFYALFGASTGMTPIEYKNRAAVSRAEQLLFERKLSVEEIGEAVGFSSGAYFRRVFERITGMSPREYRRYEQNRL